jgi:hypothetical protein
MSRPELSERELGEFSDDLARRARVTPSSTFRTQLRASLLAAPLSPPRQASGWSRLGALRPALAAVLVIALLAASGGSAAASSLPGDPAFALKRAVEDIQVALAPDDAARLDTLVTQTDSRLGDLQTAAAIRATAIAPATDEYLAAVARMDGALSTVLAEPTTAARDAAIGRAMTASATHIAMLQALATRLPAAAQSGIERAIAAQQAVHGRSGNAPGRPASPGRPSDLPVPSGRGGPPSGVPGRP